MNWIILLVSLISNLCLCSSDDEITVRFIPDYATPLRQAVGKLQMDHDSIDYEAIKDLVERQSTVDWSMSSALRGRGAIYFLWNLDEVTGGPAAIHSLHHFTSQAGFATYLHTVNPAFATPHTRTLSDFTVSMLGPEDILIVPEVWQPGTPLLQALEQQGVRIYMFTLASSQSKGSGSINPASLFQSAASGLVVGSHIHAYFGMMSAPDLVLRAPMSDAMYSEAQSLAPSQVKKDVVVLDGDYLHGSTETVVSAVKQSLAEIGVDVIIPKNLNQSQMAHLFSRAKCVLDLYLPGPERLTYEGVLFDAWPVIAAFESGSSEADFPFNDGFKVNPLDAHAIFKAVKRAVKDHSLLRSEFSAFASLTRSMPKLMRDVTVQLMTSSRFTFSILADGISEEASLFPTLYSIFHHFPLASVEVQLPVHSSQSFFRRWYPLLSEFERLGLTDVQSTGGRMGHPLRFRPRTNDRPVERPSDVLSVYHTPLVVDLSLHSGPVLFTEASRLTLKACFESMIDQACTVTNTMPHQFQLEIIPTLLNMKLSVDGDPKQLHATTCSMLEQIRALQASLFTPSMLLNDNTTFRDQFSSMVNSSANHVWQRWASWTQMSIPVSVNLQSGLGDLLMYMKPM